MAAQFNKAVVTDLGRALIADSESSLTAIEFTSVNTGNGVYSSAQADPAVLQTKTALESQKQSFPISGIRKSSADTVLLRSVLSNEDLSVAYIYNEVGIFARLKNSGNTPILFAIAVIKNNGGTEIPAYSSSTVVTIAQSIYLKTDEATSVTIDVNHDCCELVEDAGLNEDLATTDKTTLVNAINEIVIDIIPTKTKYLEETGAKNLVDVRGECVTGSSSRNGLAIFYNDDGSVRVYGTHTISSGHTKLTFAGMPILPPGRYKFSLGITVKGDCPVYLNNSARSLGDSYTYKGGIIKNSSDSLTFEITDSDVATYKYLYFQIVISGSSYPLAEIDDTYMPMFYPADSSSDDFQKFAMTNQELAERYVSFEQLDEYVSHNYLENNLPSYVMSDTVGITVNEDKSITLNGGPLSSAKIAAYNFAEQYCGSGNPTTRNHFPEGKYKLIIKDSNGNTVTYGTSGVSIQMYGTNSTSTSGTQLGTSNNRYVSAYGFAYYYVNLVLSAGWTYDHETFYPMVIPAGCTDETYKPYVKTNEQLREKINNVGFMGAQNIFDYTKWSIMNYKSGTGTCVDGEYTISVPASYDNNSGIILVKPSGFYAKYSKFEKIKVSFEIKGDDAFFVNLGFSGVSNFLSSYYVGTEWKRVSGISIFSSSTGNLCFYIRSTTATGSLPHTLYIRNITMTEASVVDDNEYIPYAKTNRDLTLDKAETSDLAPVENAATASQAYTTGAYIERPDGLYKVIADIASGGTFTVGTNIEKDTVGAELVALKGADDSLASDVSGLHDAQRLLGAKNLFSKITYYDSFTELTATENSDGSITISGTPTSKNRFRVSAYNLEPYRKYIVTGISTATNMRYFSYELWKNGSKVRENSLNSTTDPLTLSTATADFDTIRVVYENTANNVACSGTIYPMLRLATDTDNTYAPPAKTNRQLTEEIDGIKSSLGDVASEDVVPITKGGTGLTSSPSMLTNLASLSEDDVLQASPRPGVTGVLSIANGGTGTADPITNLHGLHNLGCLIDTTGGLVNIIGPVNGDKLMICRGDLTMNADSKQVTMGGSFKDVGSYQVFTSFQGSTTDTSQIGINITNDAKNKFTLYAKNRNSATFNVNWMAIGIMS